jgi:hypothetical protein
MKIASPASGSAFGRLFDASPRGGVHILIYYFNYVYIF